MIMGGYAQRLGGSTKCFSTENEKEDSTEARSRRPTCRNQMTRQVRLDTPKTRKADAAILTHRERGLISAAGEGRCL